MIRMEAKDRLATNENKGEDINNFNLASIAWFIVSHRFFSFR